MIRIGDVPALTRLGLRAQIISRNVNSRLSRLRQTLSSRQNERSNSVILGGHIPSGRAAYLDYNIVRGQFEELVDVLCFSAQNGVTVDDANRYQDLRRWFGAHCSSIHPIVAPYLDDMGALPGAPNSLLSPESLQAAINT